MNVQTYRGDVDGLRAIAVIAVLLFHAGMFHGGFGAFSGGFVGVDVFFVISGYLITRIIFGEMQAGRFSLLRFYERRIRRIVPALLVMVAGTCVAAWCLYLPADMKGFGGSAVAALGFVSNVLFYRETGYFDVNPATKPLLHTWSLSVEAQFYLAFPVFLMAVRRLGIGPRGPVWAAFAATLAYSAWQVTVNPSGAFFLPLARGWELLTGAALALGMVPAVTGKRLGGVLTLTGLALIAGSIGWYHEGMAFPGFAALAPCVGAALVIHGGAQGGGVATRLLASPLPVWVGKISYSLYLVHWPVLVFARYHLERPLTAAELAIAAAGMVALAWASWRWVEMPFRRRERWPLRRMAPALAAAAAVIAGFGLLARQAGLPERLPEAARQIAAGAEDRNPDHTRCGNMLPELIAEGRLCVVGPREGRARFLMWGDSHGDALHPAFRKLAEEYGVTGRIATFGGCTPLLGVRRADQPDTIYRCVAFADAVMAHIRAEKITDVALVGLWYEGAIQGKVADDASPVPFPAALPARVEEGRRVFTRGMARTLEALREAGVRVWLVDQVPLPRFNPPQTVARALWRGGNASDWVIVRTAPVGEEAFVRTELARFEREFGFLRLDPSLGLCRDGICQVQVGGRSLYSDRGHLSASGAHWVADTLRPMFDAMKADAEASGP